MSDNLFPVQSAGDAISKADAALHGGDTDLALLYYIRALEMDESSYEAAYKIGQIHTRRKNYRLAQMAFQLIPDSDSKYAGGLEGLGIIQLENRKYDDAEKLFAKAIDADHQRWEAHNGLGVIADLRNQHATAQSHYQVALNYKPESVRVLNNLGYSKYLSGEWHAALEYFRVVVKSDPGYERAWMNMGLIHARREQYPQALGDFRHVMDEAHANNDVGYIALMDGRYKEAEYFLREAIRLSPKYFPTANQNLERVNALRSN
jgi:Flp pilus assembly protein TadD